MADEPIERALHRENETDRQRKEREERELIARQEAERLASLEPTENADLLRTIRVQ